MKKRKKAALFVCAAVLCVIVYLGFAPNASPSSSDPQVLGTALGFLSLVPPLLAVVLAFLLHDVIISLIAGFLSGVLLLLACMPGGMIINSSAGISLIFSTILDIVTNRNNACIILLCLTIGGMVEVIRKSGGFTAVAKILLKHIDSPRKANLIGELLGIIVFFDDYANSLIVGPVMRPVTDKLNVSREKLAYIVDSTAAPVTGIAVISSWVAVEVAIINQGFAAAGVSGQGYATFLQSIPYCFYCILTLVFMFIRSLMDRDYGPMLDAERRARKGHPQCPDTMMDAESQEKPASGNNNWKRIIVAIVPIIIFCLTAIISFYFDGRAALIYAGTITADAPFSMELLSLAFGSADTYYLVMIASAAASAAAILLSASFGISSLSDAINDWIHGASSLLNTVVILVLAWSLSSIVAKLGTVNYVVQAISLNIPYYLVPTLVFISCCVISFTVGSYGCIFIAMPMAIPLALTIMAQKPFLTSSFLLACISSVLSGGIFGDHCSPITDCTILSSKGAGCDNMAHVKTQMPYALTTAAISVAAGTLPVGLGCPVWLCHIICIITIISVLQFFGRNPNEKSAPAEESVPQSAHSAHILAFKRIER
ncbi:MAG: Na+/H+ antiporter NhaC family protein [Erysipelotrichia bacterium]|nr:Na+/H+ antiporter NhaC family protein [Erysipelotrichia bacterium]